jgi:hypothetical protein
MKKDVQRIGLLVGMEWSFPPKFIAEVNGRDAGVIAEFVTLDGTSMDVACPWAVIIDRISHEVPFYRSYLKHAVLQGTAVINNPFMWSADDKFFGASLATKIGVASPKTLALPNKAYVPGIDHAKSLRNLAYPMDWDGFIAHIGLPCILKDAHGGGWKGVYVCRTREDLMKAYDESGTMLMVMQEFIEWDKFVRCLCIGQEHILPIHYDPGERKYHDDPDYLDDALRERIIRDARALVQALGYDMNSIEFAVKDGVPYAIDFMNPAPDFDITSLGPEFFGWAVEHMADLAIELATTGRTAGARRWDALLAGRQRREARKG